VSIDQVGRPRRPTLSIIVPVVDEAPALARWLPDLAGGCPEAEIIVVDGGSRDGTRDVPLKLPGIRLCASPRGRARQMNAGARVAAGEVLLFLHADTRLPEGAATALAGALTDPTVVGGRFDVRFDNPRRVFRLIARLMNWRSRLTGISTGDQAIFVRRTVFEALGGYREIALMEDIELSHRLKRAGRLACLRLTVTTSTRKWEREGIIRTILLMWALRLLYLCGVSPRRLHDWYYGRTARQAP
jgi:rSAM/selenodomain-associated transferase 2